MKENEVQKKIFFVLPSLNGGGAERVFINLAEVFTEEYSRDFDVTLVVFSGTGQYQHLIPKNIRVLDLGVKRTRHALISLFRLMLKQRPDVVISTLHAISLVGLVLLFMTKRPIHITRLANPYLYDASRLSLLERFIYRWALLSSTMIITLTERMKEEIVSVLDVRETKVQVISNPFDIEQIRSRSEILLNEEMEHPAILMCGRLAEQKEYRIALSSFKIFIQKFPSANLYILGEGALKEELLNIAYELNISKAVKFLGFQPNPYQYMTHADIFLLTSKYEGFPNVLVEALAVGIPVVSTDCFTGPAEILQGGKYGDLVPVGDINAIAQRLEENIHRSPEHRAERVASGKKRANDFNVSQVAKLYIQAIHRILEAHE